MMLDAGGDPFPSHAVRSSLTEQADKLFFPNVSTSEM